MGVAIIIPDVTFENNIGKVTLENIVPLRSISINCPEEFEGSSFNLNVSYNPSDTTQRDIIIEIESGNEYASIDEYKLVIKPTANKSVVKIKATSSINPSITANKTMLVTYYDSTRKDITSDFTFTQNYAIKAKESDKDFGKTVVVNRYKASNFVSTQGASKLIITMPAFTGGSSNGLCFYSSEDENTVIKGVVIGTASADGIEVREIEIPNSANYVRTTFRSESYYEPNLDFQATLIF